MNINWLAVCLSFFVQLEHRVLAQPIITQSPTNRVAALGSKLTLTVTAIGGLSPRYQWFKDNRRLTGATNSTLIVPNTHSTDSGAYFVAVSDDAGIALSTPALVSAGRPSLVGWGSNWDGELGVGWPYDKFEPIRIWAGVVAGAAGFQHSLYVTSGGMLWGMGKNFAGQLGNGTNNSVHWDPLVVTNSVVAVAAGKKHSLFIRSDGTLWGMGDNTHGQLGLGTVALSLRPAWVASNTVAVAAGDYTSLFIKADGTLWAMGDNGNGQYGVGTTKSTNRPVQSASDVVAVAVGERHSLFVKADGTLWAMGSNVYGQLGVDESGASYYWPTNVASNVVAVAAGANHSMFIKSDEKLYAMGDPVYYKLGGAAYSQSHQTNVANNVVSVAAGVQHSLFVGSDGSVKTMGYNNVGQLGIGAGVMWTNAIVSAGSSIEPARLFAGSAFVGDCASHCLVMGNIKSAVDVTLGGLNKTYSGGANAVTVNVSRNVVVDVTYNGQSTPPIDAGRYKVIATVNDSDYYGSVTNDLVVSQAQGTVLLGNLAQPYDGAIKSVTATTIPGDLSVSFTYQGYLRPPLPFWGVVSQPTNAGRYSVIGTIVDRNYYGSATNEFYVGVPPTNLSVLGASDQQLTLRFVGTPGYPYFVESATNLTSPIHWRKVIRKPAAASGDWSVGITNVDFGPGIFYRAGG